MRPLILLTIIILLASSCRSVRKTTVDYHQQKDSVAYSSVTTVTLDTTTIAGDTATMEAILDITESGNVIIEEVKQEQGSDINISYSVEKMPYGSTKIKVKATTKPKEIITQNTLVETAEHVESIDIRQVENTKKVTGISMWHLAWVIPVLLIIIVIYLKRKTIMKYFPI